VPITELRIEGLRTIERATLTLDGLTVLIGENGSGKSSIIEACEILRRATGEHFLDELYTIHGGLGALLRQGAPGLKLGVTIAVRSGEAASKNVGGNVVSEIESIHYDLTLRPAGSFATLHETMRVTGLPKAQSHSTKKARKGSARRSAAAETAVMVIERNGKELVFMPGRSGAWVRAFDERVPLVAQLDLPALGDLELNAIKYTAFLLKKIRVHLPFETMPAWAARSLDRKSALRSPSLFAPANHLEKLGLNLANAFHALKNQFGRDEWQRTVDYVRLGLGDRIEDVTTWADPGGGNIGLSIKQRGVDRPIPAAQLSDGTLAYLAFIALFRLNPQHPSLLALDEPDLHLHPRLLMRVLDFLETMAHENPVLVATHSDRLLDGLRDPARSVVLCELDEHDKTRLLRPNAEALERWLERYRGLGEIRGAGHEASIFTRPEDAEPRR
jgi:predicted ATPase